MEDVDAAKGEKSMSLAARSRDAGKGLYVYMGFFWALRDLGLD